MMQRMGLHLCYDLAAHHHADVRAALVDLRDFAIELPFASVGPLLTSAGGPADLHAAEWLLPLDADGEVHDRDWTPPSGTPLAALTIAPVDWHGFVVNPGRGCESASFGLARHPATVQHGGRGVPTGLDDGWRWHECCKTQHASAVSWDHFLTVHGSLVSLLQHAQELGIVSEVRDETGFWNDRDWVPAVRRVEDMNAVIRRFGGALNEALDPDVE